VNRKGPSGSPRCTTNAQNDRFTKVNPYIDKYLHTTPSPIAGAEAALFTSRDGADLLVPLEDIAVDIDEFVARLPAGVIVDADEFIARLGEQIVDADELLRNLANPQQSSKTK